MRDRGPGAAAATDLAEFAASAGPAQILDAELAVVGERVGVVPDLGQAALAQVALRWPAHRADHRQAHAEPRAHNEAAGEYGVRASF